MKKQPIEVLALDNEETFRYIYEEYYEFLCRFANQMVNDPAVAEEIVGDVIFYLWEHRQDIKLSSSIRSYLIQAVRNRSLNELNSLRRQKEFRFSSLAPSENMDFINMVFDPHEYPLGHLIEQELENQVHQCVSELPDECRNVFEKSRLEHKTYDEIASDLHISVNTVKYHMKNALAYLHKQMKQYLELFILFFSFFH